MKSLTKFISIRYLKSGGENRYFSWISILSIVGVAIGVATMIVVLSVINGFERELSTRFLNANAHIMLYLYPSGLRKPETFIKRVNKDYAKELSGVSPFIHFETMAKKSGLIHPVLVRGIDPVRREKVQSVRRWLSHPDALEKLVADPKESIVPAIVGQGVAKILELKIGDIFQLISPVANGKRISMSYKVVSFYETGLKAYDNKLIAMNVKSAGQLIGMKGRVTGVEIGLNDPHLAEDFATEMSDRYGMSARPWQSFNKNLISALQNERAMIFLVVCLVALVASANILTTLFVAVTLKQRSISVLKALGANSRQIMGIFLYQGLLMGTVGAGLGVLLALGVSWLLETYQFIDLPEPYYLTHLPVDYDPLVYSVLAGAGILISAIAGVLPAISAARVVPIIGLKSSGIRGA